MLLPILPFFKELVVLDKELFRKMKTTEHGNLIQKLMSVNWEFHKFYQSSDLLFSGIFQVAFKI